MQEWVSAGTQYLHTVFLIAMRNKMATMLNAGVSICRYTVSAHSLRHRRAHELRECTTETKQETQGQSSMQKRSMCS
jgi:hypothetical protein